jgi:hypothetical protein
LHGALINPLRPGRGNHNQRGGGSGTGAFGPGILVAPPASLGSFPLLLSLVLAGMKIAVVAPPQGPFMRGRPRGRWPTDDRTNG